MIVLFILTNFFLCRKAEIILVYIKQIFQKYLIEVREEKSFKNSLKIIYDFISKSFPELRFRLKTLVNETNQAQVDLEDYIIKKITGLSATNKVIALRENNSQHKAYLNSFKNNF